MKLKVKVSFLTAISSQEWAMENNHAEYGPFLASVWLNIKVRRRVMGKIDKMLVLIVPHPVAVFFFFFFLGGGGEGLLC